jgi:8-oxo-dGTP diphosphatase
MTMRVVRVVAAVIEKDGEYLITQRRQSAVLPLLWEFPGGRVEPGESDEVALKRELMHRLGASVSVGSLISSVCHTYANYTVELFLYGCELRSNDLAPRAVETFRWVESRKFDEYAFTPADEASMSQLLGLASANE